MKKKVLVIDDNQAVQEILTFMVRAGGYEVTVAGTAVDGMKKVKEQKPDFVILDLKLPDLPGTSVWQMIHGDKGLSGIKVIILSGYATRHQPLFNPESEPDAILMKPFGYKEVLSTMTALTA